mmetsp:Transcript_16587/g.53396  ORF Transcript_16587/g.53396 Transcript_16587/m.53396 type:complete len:219 (+) Transcript_16587:270-926(+)
MELLAAAKDLLCEVHKRIDIHVHLVQHLMNLRILNHTVELVLRHEQVGVSVHRPEATRQLLHKRLDENFVLALPSHRLHDLAHDADQQVHNSQRHEEQISQHQNIVAEAGVKQFRDERGLVCEDTIEQQTIHGLRHIVKAPLPCLCASEHLRKEHCVHVNYDHQHEEHGEHRPSRSNHPPDHGQELRHSLEERPKPGDACDPEDPQDAQARGTPGLRP